MTFVWHKRMLFHTYATYKTLITSKHGIIKGANANTAGLNEAALSTG
jgi:hypothetical protein